MTPIDETKPTLVVTLNDQPTAEYADLMRTALDERFNGTTNIVIIAPATSAVLIPATKGRRLAYD